MQYLLDFFHICPIQAAGLVHTLDDLIDIVAYTLELGRMISSIKAFSSSVTLTII